MGEGGEKGGLEPPQTSGARQLPPVGEQNMVRCPWCVVCGARGSEIEVVRVGYAGRMGR